MNRSKLINKFLKTTKEGSKRNRHRNFCVNLLHKTKRHFFGKLGHRVVSADRKVLETVGTVRKNLLNNSNKTITNEELAEIFSKHFSKLAENGDIDKTLAAI